MIQWVYEAVQNAVDELYVATDDSRIEAAVQGFGGKVVMTSPDISNGSERCMAAYRLLKNKIDFEVDVIMNIQGDEPLISPQQVKELLGCFDNDENKIATLVKPFEADEDPSDPNQVKVVVNHQGRAMYFSRALIPFPRNSSPTVLPGYLKHIGVYAYTPKALQSVCQLAATNLEKTEQLEQLRWLENGFDIHTAQSTYQNISVDTPEDLENLLIILSQK